MSPRNSILNDPCDSLALKVLSESGPSVNWVVTVDRKTIGPLEALEFPPDVFDGKEYDIDWTVGRTSSELTPRPTRTMISEKTMPIMGEVVSKKMLKRRDLTV